MSGDKSPSNPLPRFLSFTFCLWYFTLQTHFVWSSHSNFGNGNRLIVNNNKTNCILHDLCSKQLNQFCDHNTGHCRCHGNKPIRLSDEIPCLRTKLLGHVCLHSMECSWIPNAACFATILFPVELLSVPTYRQWYIYNQITESNELNYLLNKVYGQCRCKSGFRAVNSQKCITKDIDTSYACHNSTDCLFLPNSNCDLYLGTCLCSRGFYYDTDQQSCLRVGQLRGKFCVSSSDCQVLDPNLQCVKSRCVCGHGYRPDLTNKTNPCIVSLNCEQTELWNQTNSSCEPQSYVIFNSLLIKILLLLLLKLIICNLIRIMCYSKRQIAGQNIRRIHGRAFYLQNGPQSHSLLSLPPYDAISNHSNNVTVSNGCTLQTEHLPTYEEALESLQNNQGHNKC